MSGIFITEEDVQKLSTPKSYERGVDLFYSGSIYSTYRQEREIHGKCEGSELSIYDVEVDSMGMKWMFLVPVLMIGEDISNT